MRASTLLNAVLELPGVRVGKAAVVGGEVRVTVRLRRRRLGCPRCGFSTRHRYDTRDVDSSWRHLDMAGRVCRIQLRRRRLRCPEHGVRTEGVPFARDGSGHTRDFEDLVAWLATSGHVGPALPRLQQVLGAITASDPDPDQTKSNPALS